MKPNQVPSSGVSRVQPQDSSLIDAPQVSIPEFAEIRDSLLTGARPLSEIQAQIRAILNRDVQNPVTEARHQARMQESIACIQQEIVPNLKFENKIGYELEGCIVSDGDSRPSAKAPELLRVLANPNIKRELGMAQFEIDSAPKSLTGRALSEIEQDQWLKLGKIREAGAELGVSPLLVGIPPTLRGEDLGNSGLSIGPRFSLLEGAWQRAFFSEVLRTGKAPSLYGFTPESINVSSSMASVQFHLELPVEPELAARRFNAIMYVTPFVLAASGGSPFFLEGKGEWAEERIQIWQEMDDLNRGRVFYEKDWIRSPLEVVERYGKMPRLKLSENEPEDRLTFFKVHTGTTWPFLRFIIDRDNWRVENRVFSAQSPVDNVASMALYYGAVLALETIPEFADLSEKLDFEKCQANFYAAAKYGLEAELALTNGSSIRAGDYVAEILLPLARDGLTRAGIAKDDIDRYLSIIETRVAANRTMANWQRDVFKALTGPTEDRLREMTRLLVDSQASGLPVSEWPEWGS